MKRDRFFLTGLGAAFFFVPAALLAVGIVHGELTSLLWGGAFAFAWVYVVCARIWAGRLHRPQAHPETSSHPPLLIFRSDQLPGAPPLFVWRLRVSGVHSATRRFTQLLPHGSNPLTLAPVWPRGRYRVTARWELTDWFGFTRLAVAPRESATLTIEPAERAFSPPILQERRSGTWRPRRTGRRAGDPFDVRHYIPGDDLRRLHWPLYAHSDSLFVRTAEPVPPPSGHQFIVVDLSGTEEGLDARLESLMGWLAALRARDTGWTVVVPAADLVLTPSEAAGQALAGLSPSPLPDPDPSWPQSIALLTGSAAQAASLAARLTRGRHTVKPVVVPEPRRSEEKPSWWKR